MDSVNVKQKRILSVKQKSAQNFHSLPTTTDNKRQQLRTYESQRANFESVKKQKQNGDPLKQSAKILRLSTVLLKFLDGRYRAFLKQLKVCGQAQFLIQQSEEESTEQSIKLNKNIQYRNEASLKAQAIDKINLFLQVTSDKQQQKSPISTPKSKYSIIQNKSTENLAAQKSVMNPSPIKKTLNNSLHKHQKLGSPNKKVNQVDTVKPAIKKIVHDYEESDLDIQKGNRYNQRRIWKKYFQHLRIPWNTQISKQQQMIEYFQSQIMRKCFAIMAEHISDKLPILREARQQRDLLIRRKCLFKLFQYYQNQQQKRRRQNKYLLAIKEFQETQIKSRSFRSWITFVFKQKQQQKKLLGINSPAKKQRKQIL